GQIVVQNDLVGVVLHAAPAGERTALETFGLYAFPKPTGAGTAIPSGTKAYWDEANQWASAADGGGANKYIGKTAADATDDDLTVQIRMAQ
ncbi:MAG: DUF2190 family protein, partial [Planctomycetota bacterium]